MKRICVFCASNDGGDARYAAAADDFGRRIAQKGLGLVFGGGRVGLMGVIADAALASGAEVIGVIPETLVRRELAHRNVNDMRVVGSMHERKALMERLSDGFVALPGGFGTLDEFCEILTWSQLGLHGKPCGILNVSGFFDQFLGFVDHAVAQGFIRPDDNALLIRESDPGALLDRLVEGATRVRPRPRG